MGGLGKLYSTPKRLGAFFSDSEAILYLLDSEKMSVKQLYAPNWENFIYTESLTFALPEQYFYLNSGLLSSTEIVV